MKAYISINRLNYLFNVAIYSNQGKLIAVINNIVTRMEAVNYIANSGATLVD